MRRYSILYIGNGNDVRAEIVESDNQLNALKSFYDSFRDEATANSFYILAVTDVTDISNSIIIMTKREVDDAIAKKEKQEAEKQIPFSKSFQHMEIDNIIIDFMNDKKLWNLQVAYKLGSDRIQIYTDRPGLLIGPKGCYSEELKERLCKHLHYYPDKFTIEFHEIQSIVPTFKWTHEQIEEAEEKFLDYMNRKLSGF